MDHFLSPCHEKSWFIFCKAVKINFGMVYFVDVLWEKD